MVVLMKDYKYVRWIGGMRQGQKQGARLPSADLLAQALRVAGVARLHHAGQDALLQKVLRSSTLSFTHAQKVDCKFLQGPWPCMPH